MLHEKISTIVYGGRIAQARELCGLTQGQLAQRVGVNQSAIAQIEGDRHMPSPEVLEAIAKETGFLPTFFEVEPVEDFPAGSLCYRSRRLLSAREESQAYQYAKTIFEQVKHMANHLRIPALRLSRVTERPSIAAKVTRTSFGLSPDTPIKNLIHSVEKNGGFIFVLPLFLPAFDAFSTWAKFETERPIIAISSNKPADRLRFSIAHELGHLVMHQAMKGQLKAIENEANQFAGEFLLPEVAMHREIVKPVTLTNIAKLKVRWGVSMQSLIYRARELKIITERQARYLFTQMSARGWKTKEPSNLDVQPETPKAVRRMIELLYDNTEQYASDMHMKTEKATELILYS